MNDEPLDGLMDQLAAGDAQAVEQVIRRYEPYLRMVIRRQLPSSMRPKFDSMDIVQSMWADVAAGLQEARWRFDDDVRLRAFLVRAARNRLIDRQRQQGRTGGCEQSASSAEVLNIAADEARPSELAGAEDLWRQMVQACPPQHREILTLKREGASLDEIAARTGLHKSSVRRVLYDLARKLAERRPAN